MLLLILSHFHFHILSWMTQNDGRYLNSDERKRCKNFVHLQWLRPSLVISSASWRVTPHCVDPEGILDWWVKTEQGERGQLLPLLETCSHQTAVLKLADGGKRPFFFFFSPPILLIIEWWGGLGEFKKNPQARCCQKEKPRAKMGLDILEMLKKKKKGGISSTSPEAGWKI